MRLLLAHLDQAARTAFLKRKARAEPVPDSAELDRLRVGGFCFAHEESVRGVADVAVPVGNLDVSVLAALTVPVLSPSSPQAFTKRALPFLCAAADAIAKHAGLKSGTDERA